MSAPRVFDARHYASLNESRAVVVRGVLARLKTQLGLHTAIDVGCGLGYFSAYLQSLGLQVTAIDGRQDNVDEARRRHRDIHFEQCDAEDAALTRLGSFDLAFCFGLLYHLENPLRAVRHLFTITGQLILVESVCFPGSEPVMALIDEVPHEDQGINHLAFYPTENCLIKMLYRAGFPCVYRFAPLPDHPDYREVRRTGKIRTMLAASHSPLDCELLKGVQEPHTPIRPWDSSQRLAKPDVREKLRYFVDIPLPEKVRTIKRLVKGR